MKLSTYIRAAIRAQDNSSYMLAQLEFMPVSQRAWLRMEASWIKRQRQANAFYDRVTQLADEQHDLILTQEAQLDQFAQALKEAAK